MTVRTQNVEELMASVAAGNKGAFQALYDATADWVYSIALRILRESSAAEDAVQDTFVKVWRTAGRFNPDMGSARSWIGVIARNSALDLVRKRRPTEDLSHSEVAQVATNPVDPPDLKLGRCLARLPQDQATAIITMYTYGLSHSELSTLLNIPVGTVKSWIRRGTQSLKVCMESEVEILTA